MWHVVRAAEFVIVLRADLVEGVLMAQMVVSWTNSLDEVVWWWRWCVADFHRGSQKPIVTERMPILEQRAHR